jgi:Transposase, Mutator family
LFPSHPNRAEDRRESSNVRNGTRLKTVLTEATGHVQLDVPRGRDGSFDPVISEVATGKHDQPPHHHPPPAKGEIDSPRKGMVSF